MPSSRPSISHMKMLGRAGSHARGPDGTRVRNRQRFPAIGHKCRPTRERVTMFRSLFNWLRGWPARLMAAPFCQVTLVCALFDFKLFCKAIVSAEGTCFASLSTFQMRCQLPSVPGAVSGARLAPSREDKLTAQTKGLTSGGIYNGNDGRQKPNGKLGNLAVKQPQDQDAGFNLLSSNSGAIIQPSC